MWLHLRIKENVMFKRIWSIKNDHVFCDCNDYSGNYVFCYEESKLGYEITAIGKNPEFAEATGMNVGKKIIIRG